MHHNLIRPPVLLRRNTDGTLAWRLEIWQPAGRGCWRIDHYTSRRYGTRGVVAVSGYNRTRYVRPAGAVRRCACDDGRSGPCRHSVIADAHNDKEREAA